MLCAFEPVLSATMMSNCAASARSLGAIVGELRDADVIIDSLIAPYVRDQDTSDLLTALREWRNQVRGRVRARLTAARASKFPLSLNPAASDALLKRGKRLQAAHVIEPYLTEAWSRAAQGLRFGELTSTEVHKLRKDTKAVRYTADLMGAVTGERSSIVFASLKRVQDLLGYVNDLIALEHFDPPIGAERDALAALRRRIVTEQRPIVAQKLADASAEWRELRQHRSK